MCTVYTGLELCVQEEEDVNRTERVCKTTGKMCKRQKSVKDKHSVYWTEWVCTGRKGLVSKGKGVYKTGRIYR